MSPGSISDLSLSDEVAFRVEFAGRAAAARAALLARSRCSSRFDGADWRPLYKLRGGDSRRRSPGRASTTR